jgi:S-DNA-T family DNA segregation ATPase FtsK/SpoIIIE
MAARKTRKPPRRRAKRSLLARVRLPARPAALEPHQLDIIALALIACGILLAGVAYFGWSGGALGRGAVLAMKFVFGALGYAVPVALVALGGLLLARELRPPARPLRTGLLCITVALTLMLAAGTLGIGPGAASSQAFWKPHVFEARGGVIGEAELWVAAKLISTLGAQLLSVFLLIAGVILLSGATLASIIRLTGTGVAETSRALRRSTEQFAPRPAPAPATQAARSVFDDVVPPEHDTAELVIRATHVEAPPIEGAVPEELEQPEEPSEPDSEPEPARPQVEPDDLTPRGRYRSSVTDDPDFDWRIPNPRFLTRSGGEDAKPDTEGQELVAQTLLETLGHFGIDAKVIGRVTGPHITRYELRLAPGTNVAKVAQLKDDLA